MSSFVRALYHVCHQRLSNSLGQIARSCFCGDSIVWGRIPEATNLQPAIGQVVQGSCRSFLNPFSPFRTYRKYGVELSCGKHIVSKWRGSKIWPKTSFAWHYYCCRLAEGFCSFPYLARDFPNTRGLDRSSEIRID